MNECSSNTIICKLHLRLPEISSIDWIGHFFLFFLIHMCHTSISGANIQVQIKLNILYPYTLKFRALSATLGRIE